MGYGERYRHLADRARARRITCARITSEQIQAGKRIPGYILMGLTDEKGIQDFFNSLSPEFRAKAEALYAEELTKRNSK